MESESERRSAVRDAAAAATAAAAAAAGGGGDSEAAAAAVEAGVGAAAVLETAAPATPLRDRRAVSFADGAGEASAEGAQDER